jgi:hypothetical protein
MAFSFLLEFNQSLHDPGRALSLRIPEFLDSRHIKVAKMSALGTGRLYLQEISLVLISVRF